MPVFFLMIFSQISAGSNGSRPVFSFEQFRTDEKTYFATVQCVEIIGEAAKHIPAHIRLAYPGVPWNEMAGMRDKLIHAYFGTDPISVWKVVKDDLPALKPTIEQAIIDLEPGKRSE